MAGDDETIALRRPRLKIFHPPSNSCIFRRGNENPLTLAPCTQCDSWNYTPQKFLTIAGTYYCLKAVGPSLPAKLSISCSVSDSQWNVVSDSGKGRISMNLADETELCLDVDDSGTIVTNPCRSVSASDGDSQWFQLNKFC
ncbi:hypothetical protein KSP40_PGU003408 [Platanthera guangdongensis]|uniref:Ricin B lectin domain-containing protein n=1 Tax=Platanthera guangdongensis TaxID=2320717 RepID=A0ABR2ME67_9ASPA